MAETEETISLPNLNLYEQNIVVLDLEIKNEVGKSTGIKWTDFDKMGISVAATYNFRSRDYNVYMDDNIGDLIDEVQSCDLLVGYNIKAFDLKVLEHTPGTFWKVPPEEKVYDILAELRGDQKRSRGLSAGEVLVSTFGPSYNKTDDGKNAPRYYKEGKMGRLTSYCIGDVTRESWLFHQCWEKGFLSSPHWGNIQVKKPQIALQEYKKLRRLK